MVPALPGLPLITRQAPRRTEEEEWFDGLDVLLDMDRSVLVLLVYLLSCSLSWLCVALCWLLCILV
jgi:hypothetical protein